MKTLSLPYKRDVKIKKITKFRILFPLFLRMEKGVSTLYNYPTKYVIQAYITAGIATDKQGYKYIALHSTCGILALAAEEYN